MSVPSPSVRPSPVPLPLVVAQLTDIHLFADKAQCLKGMQTRRSFEQVLALLGAIVPQPDILLLTGDLSQDETPESYRYLAQLIAPLNKPTYWLPGNHDRLEAMQSAFSVPPFQTEKSCQAGEWSVILLNSLVVGQVWGFLPDEELERLEAQLQQSQRPTLIALHHPPVSPNPSWEGAMLQEPERLYQVIDRHPQVRLVLSGHIHQDFQYQRGAVAYLSTPSTCTQYDQPKETPATEQSPGFRLLHLCPDGSWSSYVRRVRYREIET